ICLRGPGTFEITRLNGGRVAVANPGSGLAASGATFSADSSSACNGVSSRNRRLPSAVDRAIVASRSAGSPRSVPRFASSAPIWLPDACGAAVEPAAEPEPDAEDPEPERIDTGTIAVSGADGRAWASIRYSRNAPAHIASTTSLRVTDAAEATARTRSNGHDCAANRRAPPIGTLNIVLGAWSGNVNACARKASLAI